MDNFLIFKRKIAINYLKLEYVISNIKKQHSLKNAVFCLELLCGGTF